MAKRILIPLSDSALFDEVFDIYKSHFLLLVGIAAVTSVPASVVTYLAHGHAAVRLVMVPLYLLEFAATTWAISQCYLGRPVGIIDSYRAVFGGSFSLVLSLLMSVVIFYIGLMICIIPGILVAFWLVFTPPAIVIENERYMSAVNRSRQLAAGNWGRIFIIAIVIIIFTALLRFVFSIPMAFVRDLMERVITPHFGVLLGIVRGLFSSIFSAIPLITLVLLYYDIRIRKEGFDIEMLARDMDAVGEGAT